MSSNSDFYIANCLYGFSGNISYYLHTLLLWTFCKGCFEKATHISVWNNWHYNVLCDLFW